MDVYECLWMFMVDRCRYNELDNYSIHRVYKPAYNWVTGHPVVFSSFPEGLQ